MVSCFLTNRYIRRRPVIVLVADPVWDLTAVKCGSFPGGAFGL
jgi:hypothetical protein